MTSSTGPTPAHDPSASDIYDPDEVFPRNSPLMKPCVFKLKPSPSPPAVPLPLVSHSPSLGGKSSNRRHKIQPTQGDAVLILHLDGGRRPEISQEAGKRPLDQFDTGSESEGSIGDDSEFEDGIRSNDMSPAPTSRFTKNVVEPLALEPPSAPASVDLRSLATDALAAAQAVSKTTDLDELQNPNHETQVSRRLSLIEGSAIIRAEGMSISSAKRPVLAPPIPPYPLGSHGELAPLQMASPRSDSSNHETLPSIRSQFFEQLHSPPKDLALRSSPHFPHSPPTGPSRLGAISGNHASPPISPNEGFRNSIPSPANTLPALSPYPYSSTAGNSHHSPPGPDYSSSKLDRSSISQILTPPTDRIADRMSIDSMTNPQVGQFICNFQGCNAQPFQTQYLLNSHANVHSSARPHYCPVKGCPRSEGGKGFKRKNEMIRHGLVHDSPGYVCPFCPDREHKYPRPDNLQRHVRVHHVDKDKDDPALREVLAQRPDGPNRGRRRRGGP
ncbi:hypothetical protein F5B22DRAFT_633054 [Xylaria bambusicola]|uniref:uncharacterized protein n=1 Tax=Xylaria bambusicola TaxID=326684 RepID=UPI002007856C|nr:uncharacterized protein F5B22DRAFT_633054 [Xylaria bambusicola]KAI0526607.1 hypothetical protein F5B22DRAFT_633054 [Xylaria bambusicola]